MKGGSVVLTDECVDYQCGHPLLMDLQQLRLLSGCMLLREDAQGLHVLDAAHRSPTHEGDTQDTGHTSQQGHEAEVNVVADGLLQFVLWFVDEDKCQLVLNKYQDGELKIEKDIRTYIRT